MTLEELIRQQLAWWGELRHPEPSPVAFYGADFTFCTCMCHY